MRTDNFSFPQDSSDIPVAVASWPRVQAMPDDSSLPIPHGTCAIDVTGDVPVVAAPDEIDIISAGALQSALLAAAVTGHGTLVVDMTRTRFCDSAGLHILIAAHKKARAEGGQVRLVIPGSPVLRVLAITGMDRVIPNFTTLAEALAPPAAGGDGRSRQRTEGDARAQDQPVQPAVSQ